jgi:2-polyprenyl-3-methyl-5-hydroxy-6-metoxy-1,4-benzoquinol methylase
MTKDFQNISNEADTTIYEGAIDLRVRNNSHTIAYFQIAEAFLGEKVRILDVGCNTGYFGEVLKRAGHSVFGVELSESAAAIAIGRLDQVYTGTVDAFLDAPAHHEERFDCIIFGDVLEHLVNPGEVLQRIRERLTPKGIVIASVPNATHLSVRLMLLGGRWEYSDRGILDRTHLRFFDKHGLVELFAFAGYHVMSVATVRLPAHAAGITFDPILLDAVTPYVSDDAANIFQYVVQARPGEPNQHFANEPGANVLLLPPIAEWPIGEIRLSNPLTVWAQKYGGEIRSRCISDFLVSDITWADVIVLQRESDHHVIDLIRLFQQHGKAVIFDIDDLLTDVPKFLSTYAHHNREKPHLETALRNADMVTTTTKLLATKLSQYNSRIAVIPNSPLPVGECSRHYIDTINPVTIFVASSDTVRVDFIVPTLRRLTTDNDIRIQIIGIGPPGEFIENAGIPITRIDNLSYQSFLDFISSYDNAIGVIPLDASIFSSCKSAIKFLDYGLCGVASVCSNVQPYSDMVHNGVTGILVDNNEDSWYQAIRRLILDFEERSRLATAARKLCCEHYSLSNAADIWQTTLNAAREHRNSFPLNKQPLQTLNLPLNSRFWVRKLTQYTTYRSAISVLLNEGWGGVKKRLRRLVL